MTNIKADKIGHLKTITLDRPEVLNALNSEMVDALASELEEISANPEIKAVFVSGAGGRAFCAGGDIKAARLGAMAIQEGRIKLEQVVDFFVREYALNKRLYHFEKPTVSFMDGITMGGGVGVAGACRYRIATENTKWAMPEVSIGFFPDVGAAHYLAKAPHYAGRYLGLTGATLSNPADLIKCGFATHFIHGEKKEIVLRDLETRDDIDFVLDSFSANAGETELPYKIIEKCFSAHTVEGILSSLENEGSSWAKETAALIRTKSPTSLKTALRHIELAEAGNFDDVITRDLKLAGIFLQGQDLIEGVRAVVVDKDRAPKWKPDSLKDVEIERIKAFFN